jgi:prophage regulatory protein
MLPTTGFLRIRDIIGDRRSNPPVAALIPVSRSTWWAGVQSGRFPRSLKLSPGVTVWRAEAIRELIANLGAAETAACDEDREAQAAASSMEAGAPSESERNAVVHVTARAAPGAGSPTSVRRTRKVVS